MHIMQDALALRRQILKPPGKTKMEEAMPLTMNERAAVAVFAVRLQNMWLMSHAEKINLCCEIVAQTRAGARPKELCQHFSEIKPAVIYRVISRARRAGLLPAFKPILIGKARSMVTELKLGPCMRLRRLAAMTCCTGSSRTNLRDQPLLSSWLLFSAMRCMKMRTKQMQKRNLRGEKQMTH